MNGALNVKSTVKMLEVLVSVYSFFPAFEIGSEISCTVFTLLSPLLIFVMFFKNQLKCLF